MQPKVLRNSLLLAALITTASLAAAVGNPCNPCAPKVKNPCAAVSDHIDAKLVTRPTGTQLAAGKTDELLKEGEKLWNSKSLSTNGMSCQTCHQANGAFKASFVKPYPHTVAMANDRAGLKKIALDEMVQLCMVAPMAAKTMPWDSRELAALTAYTGQVQKHYKPAAANPCAAKNPCAPKQ